MSTKYDEQFAAGRATCTVKDISAEKFIAAFAKHMKTQGKFELPKWADVVKTGVHKELAPLNPDWLYIRAASIARHVYNRGGSGVGSFRKVYGGQQRRGTCTNHFRKASGKVIRYCMLQLEDSLGIIEVDEKGGRRLTPEGQREMDTVAVQCLEEEEEEEFEESDDEE